MNRTFFALFAMALLAIVGCNRPNKDAKNTETTVDKAGIYSISVKDRIIEGPAALAYHT